MTASDPRRIAVIGAGIGGLTLALALRQSGIAVATAAPTSRNSAVCS
jgi:2-polyprenyl-6-methoxyphenol hydroxylase-like FAD-dependent oxidoreductase